METKYGRTETYQYVLDKERLNWLTNLTNRSDSQTQFLYQLVDGDFDKLVQLETHMKRCFFWACPDSKETVEEVFKLVPKSKHGLLAQLAE